MAKKDAGESGSRTIRLTDEVTVAPFLGHALAATLATVGVPLAILIAFDLAARGPLVSSLICVGVAVVLSALGATLWARVPESDAIEFGELMLWSWFRRHRAEQKVHALTRDLDLDARGNARAELPRARKIVLLKELTAALQEKDSYTRGHSARVERYAFETALTMRLPEAEMDVVRTAGSVHDVGKISVPDEILRKPGALTDLEFETMKSHSEHGAQMVDALGNPSVTAAVRHHHERWDGRGYPAGLVAQEIPLPARLIAVADTFDALTSTRTYRAKHSRRKAVEILESEKGSQFDPSVVDAFLTTQKERAGYLLATPLFLLPADAMARLGSWARKRSDALAAAAIVLLASVIGSVSIPESQPSTPIAVDAQDDREEPTSPEPGDRGNGPVAIDRNRPRREPTVVTNPPADEVTVLGTRVRADEPATRDRKPPPRPIRRPASPSPTPTAPAEPEASWPPGHAKKEPGRRDVPPGQLKKRDGEASGHSADCGEHPGRGNGKAWGRRRNC